jgi:surfactin synthase thioesterase subunit
MASLGIFRDVLVILAVGLVIAGFTAYNRDLPQPAMVELTGREDLAPIGKRHVEHVTLHTDHIGDIGLALSMPDPPPTAAMPIVIVLGGLDSGENNIHNIPDAGNNIIVGYDWPMPLEAPKGPAFLLETPEFYMDAMNAPAQIASAIDWLATQTWADPDRISILGYSMGALAAPAAEDLTQQTDRLVQWTILAYGGAPLASVFVDDAHIKPIWMRWLLAPFIALMLHPLEPTEHLPNLSGHFLVIEGKDDRLISESARAALHDAVPDPKSVVVLEGDHMGVGPDKEQLLQQIITTSRDWLVHVGAVNPL